MSHQQNSVFMSPNPNRGVMLVECGALVDTKKANKRRWTSFP